MITNIESKLKFIELVDDMKNIERAIRLRNGREETNAEHSYHLAMMVIIFADDFPKLNILRSVKLALLHDIVEIFAWDTVIFDKKMEKTKDERESNALLELEQILWKEYFSEYKELIEDYINVASIESEFVHQMDKFQPIMQIVMQWWDSWHEYKIDKKMLLEKKYSQINDKFWLMKILNRYFEKAERKNMFYIK